jgi:hypothetical protein
MNLSHAGAAPLLIAVLFAPAVHAAASPEQRAIDYLAREVRQWSRENRCFSCHNNGDGARALYAAAKRGYSVPADALSETTAWLRQPGAWKKNRSNPSFSDQKLADIQFAAALADSQELPTGAARAAADLLTRWQNADGSWRIDAEADVGSPVTWGTTLATYMAQRALEKLDETGSAEQINRSRAWLASAKPASLLDVSVLAMSGESAMRRRILDAQTSDGGWGPQPGAPAEPFDTAMALLALGNAGEPVARGREYLVRTQLEDGGWPPTTRPAGAQSYAQHISTTAWAALALMATDSKLK